MSTSFSRPTPLLAGAALFTLLSLPPATASADCVNPADCLCSDSPADAVLTIAVSSADDSEVTGEVEVIDLAPDKTTSVTVGDMITAKIGYMGDGAPAAGDRLLVSAREDGLDAVIVVDSDDRVTCYFAPDYRPTLEDARKHILSASCHEDVFDEMPPQECNDTVTYTTCSVPAPGAGETGWLTWIPLAPLGFGLLQLLRLRRAARKQSRSR